MLTARIAVVVSGGGTNLQALIDAQTRGELKSGRISLVIADKDGVQAISRAGAAGIVCAVIPRKEPGFEEKVLSALETHKIDMVVLAGFLGIFSADLLRRFQGVRCDQSHQIAHIVDLVFNIKNPKEKNTFLK